MLTLLDDWESCTAKGVTFDLLGQVDKADEAKISAAMIWASLKLHIATAPTKRGARIRRKGLYCWSVQRLHYCYFPVIDRRLLFEIAEWDSKQLRQVIITPPDQDCLLGPALKICLGKKIPTIFSLDGFMDFREFFAHADSPGISRGGLIRNLLCRYNQTICKLGRRDLRCDLGERKQPSQEQQSAHLRVSSH